MSESILNNFSLGPDENIGTTGDLRDLVGNASAPVPLEADTAIIRISDSETPVMLFTTDYTRVLLHYNRDGEPSGYFHCNGDDCLACKVGFRLDERLLLPAYNPMERSVGYLSMSKNMRPNALLPQLLQHLAHPNFTELVLFITKMDYKFSVSAKQLPEDADRGESIIRRFVEEQGQGKHSPVNLFNRVSNNELYTVPVICEMAKLKGLG